MAIKYGPYDMITRGIKSLTPTPFKPEFTAAPVMGASRGLRLPGMGTQQPLGPTAYPVLPGISTNTPLPTTNATGGNYGGYTKPVSMGISGVDSSQVNPYNADGTTKTNDYIMKRAIATSKTPVVDRTTPTKDTLSNVNYSDIEGMDMGGLQDYINTAYVRGGQIDDAEKLRIMKAQQRIQQLQQESYISSMQDPYKSALTDVEKMRARMSDPYDLTSDQIKAKSDYEKVLNEQQNEAMIASRQLAEEEKKATLEEFSNRGMANSTDAQIALSAIDKRLSDSIKAIDDIRIAELSRYQEELKGVNVSRLEQHDAYIAQLRQKSAEYQVGLAQQINDYNQSTNATYEQKIQSLFATSNTLASQMNVEYDDEDNATAQNYAAVILDDNGNIDADVLKTVPDYLIPLVYKYAAESRGAKASPSKGFDLQPGNDKGGVWKFNKDTGETEWVPQPGSGGGGGSGGGSPVPTGVQEVVVANGKPTNKTLDKIAADPLNKALEELRMKGIYTLIGSGTRSTAEQQKLYDNYLAGKGGIAAPPGQSKHENGMAVDLYSDDKFGAPSKEIIDTLRKYGWENKAIPGDAGHFEYVGTNNQIREWLIGNLDMRMSNDEREAKIGYIDSLVASDNKEGLGQLIADSILKDDNVAAGIYSARAIIGAIDRVDEMLSEYQASGKSTNSVKALAEIFANTLGITTDSALARINGSLGALVADYIRAISGASASEMEASRLNSFLPKIKNTMEFNKALITNIKEMATAKQRTLLETKFLVDPTYMKIAFRDLYPEDNMGNTASNTGNTSTPQGYDLSLAR